MSGSDIDTGSAAATLRALANAVRLQIVFRLLDGEAPVAELERELGLRQPGLSQQLGELREAGLVATRRDGKSVIYRLAGPGQERLVAAISAGFGAVPGNGARSQAARPSIAAVRARRQAHLSAVFARVEPAA